MQSRPAGRAAIFHCASCSYSIAVSNFNTKHKIKFQNSQKRIVDDGWWMVDGNPWMDDGWWRGMTCLTVWLCRAGLKANNFGPAKRRSRNLPRVLIRLIG